MKKKENKLRRFFGITALPVGIIFILLGILGLILPIVPGWLLIFVGFAILGKNPLTRYIKKLKAKV